MSLEDGDSLPPDEEELSGEEFADALAAAPFHLAHSTLSLNKAYVLHVSASSSSERLAASFSNRQVNVYSGEGLTLHTNLRPHESAVTGMAFRYFYFIFLIKGEFLYYFVSILALRGKNCSEF
jgi:hypothetical protein